MILFYFRNILVNQLPSDSCLENSDLNDEYCLEKNVADALGCFFPGTAIEGEGDEYKDCNLLTLKLYFSLNNIQMLNKEETFISKWWITGKQFWLQK